MLLVIFGAGASFDSADQLSLGELPPPLAKDLAAVRFNDIAATFPSSQSVIARLRLRMSNRTESLEKELAELAERSKGQPERREQLMSFRYYLQRVITQSVGEWMSAHHNFTRYLDLINELYDRQQQGQIGPIRFATFNYDLMLEEALHSFYSDWNVATMNSYVARDDFRVFKLHGSVNWSRVLCVPINHIEATTAVAARMARDDFPLGSGVLELGTYPEMVTAPSGDYELYVPALAVPMADKTDFECPAEHVTSLSGDIDAVTHVLIVGWRGAERHAVELLERLRQGYKLALVTGSDADSVELTHNLGKAFEGRADVRIKEPNGFASFMAAVDSHLDAFFA